MFKPHTTFLLFCLEAIFCLERFRQYSEVFVCTYVIHYSHALHSFALIGLGLVSLFFCLQTSLPTSYGAGLLVMNSFSFCHVWKSLYFIFSFESSFCWIWNCRVTVFFFSFKYFKPVALYLLDCIIFNEEYAIILIFCSCVCNMSLFSGCI